MATDWHYIRRGMFSDETIGPLSEDAFCDLLRSQQLKRSTTVMSSATGGQWVALESVPYLLDILKSVEESQRASAALEKCEKNAAAKAKKEQKAKEAEERKQQRKAAAEQAEREAEQQRRAFAAAQVATPALQSVGFTCPFCKASTPPRTEKKTSTAGIIFAIVLFLFLCWPLFWIGFFIKEEHTFCSTCGMKLA